MSNVLLVAHHVDSGFPMAEVLALKAPVARMDRADAVIVSLALKVSKTGDSMSGPLLPSVNGTINLGSATFRWGTIYTSDLSLKNDVGDWTVVEGENDLFITNNKTGKKYKFALIEVE